MRGEIIQYFEGAGSGLISGADGVRYSFTDEQVGRREGLRIGAMVDFVIVDGLAREIYALSGSQPAAEGPQSTNEDLTLWGYFVKCMRLYFDGRGRARRKEYWSFVLFAWLSVMGLLIIGAILLAVFAMSAKAQDYGADRDAAASAGISIILFILFIPFLAPHVSVTARRLHDVGLNGWLAALLFLPYLGGLFIFIVALLPSNPGRNQYGPCPKPLRS